MKKINKELYYENEFAILSRLRTTSSRHRWFNQHHKIECRQAGRTPSANTSSKWWSSATRSSARPPSSRCLSTRASLSTSSRPLARIFPTRRFPSRKALSSFRSGILQDRRGFNHFHQPSTEVQTAAVWYMMSLIRRVSTTCSTGNKSS